MRFKDKVVLVTGGSEGLGKGIVDAFVREGARVAINGRNAEKLASGLIDVCQTAGASSAAVIGVAADIGDSAAVSAMFAEILAKFGTLDILINNAALTPSDAESAKSRIEFMQMITTPIAKHSLKVTSQMSDERWLKMINTNLNGLFYCTREALRIMEPKGYGKIVNVGSVAGIRGVSAHSPHYSATAAWDEAAARVPGFMGQIMQMIPAGRIGTIEEYSSLALYLSSDDAGYLMGQIISPNGGMLT